MGKKRKGPSKDTLGTPGGDLALFLNHELEKREWSAARFYESLVANGFDKTNPSTVSAWLNGTSTPRYNDQAVIAASLGYKDWIALVAAIGRYMRQYHGS